MCNCGNRRQEFSRPGNVSNVNTGKDVTPKDSGEVRFMYVGKTALSAIGNITHRRYRFNFPGDEQNVDYQDVHSMMTIKVLRRLGE